MKSWVKKIVVGGLVAASFLTTSGTVSAASQTLKLDNVYVKAGIISGSTTKGSKLVIKKDGKTVKTITVKGTSFKVTLSGLKKNQKISVVSTMSKKSKTVDTRVKESPAPKLTLDTKKVSGTYLVLSGKTEKNTEIVIKNGKEAVGKQVTKSASYSIKIAKNKLKSNQFSINGKNVTTYGEKTITAKLNYKEPSISGTGALSVTSEKGFNAKSGVTAKDSIGQKLTLVVKGTVDVKKNGVYTIVYTATDAQGFSKRVERKVTVANKIKPTISGTSDATVNKSAKTFDVNKGITAKDSQGKALTFKVTGKVDMAKSGVYTLTYTATDKSGNTVSVARKITVLNDIKPTISGTDDDTVNMSTKTFDANKGVTAKDSDGNNLIVQVAGTVDMSKAGVYVLTYTAVDKTGNTASVVRNITVVNDIKPTITGVNAATVKKSSKNFDAYKGVVAKDSKGDIVEFKISGTVNMTKSGVYELTYTAIDQLGNSQSIVRKVTVLNDIKPVISGADNVTITKTGAGFDFYQGVRAKDSDGHVLELQVTGSVDTTTTGKYPLTYTATDQAGNTISSQRTITVTAPQATGINIQGKEWIKSGETYQFYAALTPEWSEGQAASWESSDTSVAEVDQNGYVTGGSAGTAVITATIIDKDQKIWSKNYTITVDDTIEARLYAYSQITINNYSTSISVTVTNNDFRTLHVTRVKVDDGTFWSSDYTKEKLAASGINTAIASGKQFGVSLSSRFGWYTNNLKVIVTVETDGGVTKELVYDL